MKKEKGKEKTTTQLGETDYSTQRQSMYAAPVIEVIEVMCERGFAVTGDGEDIPFE